MAIIVDKVQKKKDIALSCKDLFVNNSINSLTIAQVAKTAGVGKGTMYEYFKNKEDIVFEIINILIQDLNKKKEAKLAELSTTKDKIKVFFHLFYDKEDEHLRALYKEFISISLASKNQEMIDYQTRCSTIQFEWFEKIIQDGIDAKELKPNSKALARGLFVLGGGMFIESQTTDTIQDIEKELDIFFDTLFELIEVKHDKN